MDKRTTPSLPLPPTLVDCPWCEAPVELAVDGSHLACSSCQVVVEVAPAAGRRAARSTHRRAA